MTAEFILALAALVTAAAGFLKVYRDVGSLKTGVSDVKSDIGEVKTLVNGNHKALEDKLDRTLVQRDEARAEVRQQQRQK